MSKEEVTKKILSTIKDFGKVEGLELPTVKELIKNIPKADVGYIKVTMEDLEKVIIKFTRQHVEEALKAAHRNMQLLEEDLEFTLSAYPLSNVK